MGSGGCGVVALLVAGGAGWLVRARRMRAEALTGESLRHNTWGVAVFVLIGGVAYAALQFPVRWTLPGIVESDAGFLAYAGGILFGLGYISALVSLTLYFSAFIAEIVRGSIQAVPRGQTEASASLGLSAYQRFSLIVPPTSVARHAPVAQQRVPERQQGLDARARHRVWRDRPDIATEL